MAPRSIGLKQEIFINMCDILVRYRYQKRCETLIWSLHMIICKIYQQLKIVELDDEKWIYMYAPTEILDLLVYY